MTMNREQSDALCAIIALGFVGQNQRTPEANRTLYIYDAPDAPNPPNHAQLAGVLRDNFDVNIEQSLQNANDAITGRKIHPFIYALPCGNDNEARLLTYSDVKRNEAELLQIVQAAEDAVNAAANNGVRLRGAYIGGFIDYKDGRITLLGPSSLYLRDRMYLDANNPAPQTLAATYTEFSRVTAAIKDFLENHLPALMTDGAAYENIITSPDLTDALISESQPGDGQRILDGKAIASCHGLVTSMYYHSDVGNGHLDDGVCIELSFSADTCKSASCLPCAIFAASQGSPASAVHFGRGDFWNLPELSIRNSLNPNFEENWRSYVIACFKSASLEILERDYLNPVTRQMAALAEDDAELVTIPDMFLDALTFEGPFLRKMIDYLQ